MVGRRPLQCAGEERHRRTIPPEVTSEDRRESVKRPAAVRLVGSHPVGSGCLQTVPSVFRFAIDLADGWARA